jgi:hypothetical protein
MIHYITHINDFLGDNYLGVKITSVQPFLDELKDILGENDYNEYTKCQQDRDHNSHHITVINVMEYNMLCKEVGMDKFVNSLDKIFKYGIDDLKMMGIGTAAKNENRAYFIVCKSDKLDAVRNRYGLTPRDLHITIGFKYKDVFGVRKNEVMKKNGRFLKLLSQEFYNNENWNFIKKIGNFDLDVKSDLIPVALDKSKMKFKCDGYFIDITFLEDGEKFWVATKYPINKDLPRLPEAEIKKILKLN